MVVGSGVKGNQVQHQCRGKGRICVGMQYNVGAENAIDVVSDHNKGVGNPP